MARVKKPKAPAEHDLLPEVLPSSREDALIELGLSGVASDEEVRNAFRLRLKTTHPDLNGGTDVLLRRLILARDLLMKDAGQRPDTTELLEAFAHTDQPVRIDISLTQAIFGGEATACVPALEVSGASEPLTSLTQMKALTVPLRPGLRNGDIVAVATDSLVNAEQLFRIHIAAESGVRIWGDDIWMTAHIESRLFALGGLATIDTPHGAHDAAVEKGTAHGSSLCLKGLGLPATATAKAGDLHIRLEAETATPVPFGDALGAFRHKWIVAA